MESKTGPKDIFLHLLSIIALYVSVGTLITLVFQYINYWIPDPLEVGYVYISSIFDSIRWAISILIVIFPVYCWTLWFLNKGYRELPERMAMKSRKWLIYLTIFLAALLMIGDFVALIYLLLRGEFTARFLLKVLTIILVAGAAFFYYLREIKRQAGEAKTSAVKIVSYVAIAAVVVLIVGGFFIVGSPKEERAYRFDVERVQDLSAIQNSIINYWQGKKKLPETLTQIPDGINIISLPTDPETGKEYEYKMKGMLSFELCANFNKEDRSSGKLVEPLSFAEENWVHDAGRVCFSRTIDPERIPPLEKIR